MADGPRLLIEGRLSLREFLLPAKSDGKVGELAGVLSKRLWTAPPDQVFFEARVVVLEDGIFDAMARNALGVRARVAIDGESGTSGPWMEEHIPAESVLAGLVLGRPTRYQLPIRKDGGTGEQDREPQKFAAPDMLKVLTDLVDQGRSLRLGGHSSIGLGRAHLRIEANS